MAPPPRKLPTTTEVALAPLKNCLVNLPASLITVLWNANVAAQNVIVEMQYKSQSLTATPSAVIVQKHVYVGWTGLPSRARAGSVVGRNGSVGSGREQDISVCEIDNVFAGLLGLVEGQKVRLSLHSDPPMVHTVNVEPLTPVDWEMIELHGNFLELNLLSQVRALPNPDYSRTASSHAEHTHPLILHLSPTSTVKIIVTSLTPPVPTSSPFAKISPDAEVIVAPKVRPRVSQVNRDDDRSIVSTSRRSARGSGSALPTKDAAGRNIVIFRGVDRVVCHEYFDPHDGEDEYKNLVVWVHEEALESEALRGRKWVVVSIVRPNGLRAPLDQHQMQQLKEQELGEAGLPSTQVIAELRAWADAPDELQAALSATLSCVLGFERFVGGIVTLEAAPAPIQKSELTRVKVYPFLPESSPRKEGLRFGGDTKLSKQAIASRVKEVYGGRGGILQGPISDGMLLPPSPEQLGSPLRFEGGIVRLESSGGQSKDHPLMWSLGLNHNLALNPQAEIPRTMAPTTIFPTLGATLPRERVELVGVDHVIAECMSNLALESSVLLTGGIGSGKTDLSHLLCQRLSDGSLFNTTYFSCRTLLTDETRISTVSEILTRLFMSASWCARLGGQSLVVLDDLDKICPVERELQMGNDNGRSRLITEILCSIVRHYCKPGSGVTLLATALAKESLNHVIVGGHILGEIIDLKAPDKDTRRKILQQLAKSSNSQDKTATASSTRSLDESVDGGIDDSWSSPQPPASATESIMPSANVDLLDLAGRTDGFMPSDLKLLLSRARNESLIRTISAPSNSSSVQLTVSRADIDMALKNFTPSSLRSVPLTRSNTTFSSVGGHSHTRKTLLETLLYPTKYAPIFSSCPLRLRSGLLLYGYPGCGKTLLASAVAGECGLNFISVKGPEILNKYIGASEKSVRDLFERAQAAKPCVLFFDEFDSVAPKRGHDSTGVTDRVVNQLLTQMDGAEGSEGVYVLAATSRPDLIDPALLRPGRLDKSLLCDMPDHADRVDILSAVSKGKLVLEDKVEQGLEEIASRADGFSGADLQALMYNAHLEAVHELIGDESNPKNAAGSAKHHAVNGKSRRKNRLNEQYQANDVIQFLFDPDADTAAGSTTATTTSATFDPPAVILEKLASLKAAQKVDQQHHDDSRHNSHRHRPRHHQPHQQHRHQTRLSSSRPTEDPYRDDDDDNNHNNHNHNDPKQIHPRGPNPETKTTETSVVTITWPHVERALASTRPSISQHERGRLRAIYREFVVGRNGEMPSGEGAGREVGGRSSLM